MAASSSSSHGGGSGIFNRTGSTTVVQEEENEEDKEPKQEFSVRVIVHRGRNLLPKDVTGLSDPYLKITVGKLTKKTSFVNQTLDPDWGDANFLFPISSLEDTVAIEVWDKDVLSADDSMGHLAPIPVMSCPWWSDNSDPKQLAPVSYAVVPPAGDKAKHAGELELSIRREPRLLPGVLNLSQFALHLPSGGVKVSSFSVRVVGLKDPFTSKGFSATYHEEEKKWLWDKKLKFAIEMSDESLSGTVVVTVFGSKKRALGSVAYPVIVLAEERAAFPSLLLEKSGRPASIKIPIDGQEKTVSLSFSLESNLSSYRSRSRFKHTVLSDQKRILRINIDPHPIFTEYELSDGTKAVAITPQSTSLQIRDSLLTLLSRKMAESKRADFIQKCQFFFLHEASQDRTKDRMLRTSEKLWGTSPDSNIVLSEFSVSSRRSSFYGGVISQRPMFGVDLEQLYLHGQTKNNIPVVIYDCALALLGHLKHVGLFRLSGNSKVIERYIDLYNTSPRVVFESDMSPDSTASLMKRFFIDLPEPLFPMDRYEEFLAISDRLTPQGIRNIINTLPAERLVLSEFLFTFLSKVASFQEVNMMSPSNLGVCYGPTLLRSLSEDPMKMIADSKKVNDIVTFIIIHYSQIFAFQELPRPIESSYQLEEEMGSMQILSHSGNLYLGEHFPIAPTVEATSPEFEAACVAQKSLDHPYLLKTVKIVKESTLSQCRSELGLWIIQEYAHSTLVETICRGVFPFSQSDIRKCCRQILQAIDFLHQKKLAHGNFSEGIVYVDLVEGEAGSVQGWNLKLGSPATSFLFAPFNNQPAPTIADDIAAIGRFFFLLFTGNHLPDTALASPEFEKVATNEPIAANFLRRLLIPTSKPPTVDSLLANDWFRESLTLSSDTLDQAVTNLKTTVSLFPTRRKAKWSSVL